MDKKEFKQQVEADQIRLQKIFEGNEKEFNRLYNECRKLINQYTFNYQSISEDDVEDIYSEACYVCYANIRSGKLQLLSCRLIDYISRVMKYKLIDKLNIEDKTVRIPNNDLPDIELSGEDETDIRMRIVVSQYVNKMINPCKTILEKFYLDGWSYERILPILPSFSSIFAIKTRSYKCKKEIAEGLRTTLKANDIDLYRYKN